MDDDDGETHTRWFAIGCVILIGVCLLAVGAAVGGWAFLALGGIAVTFVVAALIDQGEP